MTVTVVDPSGNQDIDGILWGWKFPASNISYSFPTKSTQYGGYAQINGFQAFSGFQENAVRQTLGEIASFTNLTFAEQTSDPGDAYLRYGQASSIDYTDDSKIGTHTGLHTETTAEAGPPEDGFKGKAPYTPQFAQGDGWFNPTGYDNPTIGSFELAAGIMHETGHNLGLKHGHVTQGGHGVTFPALPSDHNSFEYSVMTYSQFVGDNLSHGGDNALDHPTTYMQDDIAALQYMYGANYGASANNTDTIYSWDSTTGQEFINGVGQVDANSEVGPADGSIFMTIWDGGGINTYNFSNYTTSLNVSLIPGGFTILDTSAAHAQRADLGNNGGSDPEHFARGNIFNAQVDPNNTAETASLIKNAIGGSGNDVIVGNELDNFLQGGVGNDTIKGGSGADFVDGGANNDTLEGNSGDDFLFGGDGDDILTGGDGADRLDGGAGNNTASYVGSFVGVAVDLSQGMGFRGDAAGDTFVNVENLTGWNFGDILTGDGKANILRGEDGDDLLNGGDGADRLDGGNGIDEIHGGLGNDVLIGGTGADLLDGGDGVDTASYADAGSGVVIDLLSGIANDGSGSFDDLISIETMIGSNFDDTLIGDAGNNVLDGGAGADTMDGFGGNDLYIVDNAADGVFEQVGFGDDTVEAGVSYTLAAGQQIETLETTSAAGTTAINLTGNEFNNTLIGNAAANVLKAGAGADTMYGYAGNDVFYVDNAKDRVIEAAGNGADKVVTSVSYALKAGQSIEILQASGASTGVKLTGNEIANTLIGDANSNILNGGAGADTMYGHGGNDVFYVDNAKDRVIEAVGNGTDKVLTSVSYTLAAGQEIETLATIDTTGTTPINLTGNEFANVVMGNAGANVIRGGLGNDKLYGNGGNDTFVFDTTPGSKTNDDTVADFTVGHDMIDLSHAIYGALAQGALADSAFTTGSRATTANQHAIYNPGTGALLYDADGSGAGAAVQLAKLSTGLALSAHDFAVVA